MEILSSKIGFKRAILPGYLLLMFNGMFLFLFIEKVINANSINESVLAGLIFGLIVIGIMDYFSIVYILYTYPKVKIFDDKMTINNYISKEVIDFSDVKSVDLCGSKSIKFFFYSFFADAIEIERLNGKKLFVFVDSYRNSQQIRLTLADRLKVSNLNDLVVKEISEELGELITINKWNIFVLHFWVFMFLTFFLIMIGNIVPYSWIPYLFCLGTFYLGSLMVNYIQYNDKFIVIRNNLKPWYCKKYRIEDIVNVIFDSGGRAPRTMSITLKDFSKKIYVVEGVGVKNLTNLRSLLSKKGIEVNGIIY